MTDAHDAPPEYSLKEAIKQLEGWRKGQRMYPIETAISAQHWFNERLSNPPPGAYPVSFQETLAEVNAWLLNEESCIPEDTAMAMLFWLRQCDRVPLGAVR